MFFYLVLGLVKIYYNVIFVGDSRREWCFGIRVRLFEFCYLEFERVVILAFGINFRCRIFGFRVFCFLRVLRVFRFCCWFFGGVKEVVSYLYSF